MRKTVDEKIRSRYLLFELAIVKIVNRWLWDSIATGSESAGWSVVYIRVQQHKVSLLDL